MHCYLDKREGSDNWYIYEYNEATGQCRRFSARTADREAAEKKLAEYIIKRPERQQFSDVTLVWIMLRYYEHHGKGRFSADTVKRVLALIVEHEAETKLHEFDLERQMHFAGKCGKSSATKRRYMGVVRAACQWAFDRGEIKVMPAILKVKAQDGEGVRPFSVDELRKLFSVALHEHERRILVALTATACRPGAVLDLTWDRIDAATGVVDYRVPGREVTKKRRARAPLCGIAHRFFEDRRSVGPVIQWNGKRLAGFKMTFKRLTERAGVKGTAYGVRKAVSIWLRRQGVHEWDIKGMLGHAIGGETERYAHYRPEYMRGAANATEALLQEICPPWLASYLPVHVPREAKALIVGGRDRDRTCDPYHVKEDILAEYQYLKPANDD
jgi:integrase